MILFMLVGIPILAVVFLLGVQKLEGLCDETWL